MPRSQPIRCKTKTIYDLVARVFPRFWQFALYFEFSLALKGIFLLIGRCDTLSHSSLERQIVLRIVITQFFSLQIEREVEEQREGLSSSFKENKNPISPVAGDEGKEENLEEKETLATDTMMFSQKLQKKKEALLKRIAKLQRQREE